MEFNYFIIFGVISDENPEKESELILGIIGDLKQKEHGLISFHEFKELMMKASSKIE